MKTNVKKVLTISLFVLLNIPFSYAQSKKFNDNITPFNSVFQNLKQDDFIGTINGILLLERDNGKELILEFQGSEAKLQVIPDEDEVYDISTKSYTGYTSSKKTKINYSTYALANKIDITLSDGVFSLSLIDGACDAVINGLHYYYKSEKDWEYLIIKIEKEITLSNWQYLLSTNQSDTLTLNELKKQKKEVKLLPQSCLVFAIQRK